MNDNFEAPPAGAVPTAHEYPPQIQYAAGKIGTELLQFVTPEFLAQRANEGKVGFSYYNSDTKTKIRVNNLSFVALQVYVGLKGYEAPKGVGKGTNYWSSRATDTRKEPIILWTSGVDGPTHSGFYVGKKHKEDVATIGGKAVPAAAKFKIFIMAYCLEMDKVVELEVSNFFQNGLKRAIAIADGKPGNWDKIFILGLCANDHLWGFKLTGYSKVTRSGEPHTGEVEMFFEPTFFAKVLNPIEKPELHAKCVQLQQKERDLHEAFIARNAQYVAQTGINTAITATSAASVFPPAATVSVPTIQDGDSLNDLSEETDDDLPF